MNIRSARGPAAGSTLKALLDGPIAPGRLVWIGVRPDRRESVLELADVELVAGRGVAGDRYRTTSNGARQVTLIERERLAAIASYLGRDVHPSQLRRNLMVEGINLLALKDRRFRIGSALLEWSGECHPCSRMDETLGPGGYNAVRSHGGITARVLEGAVLRVDDRVERMR
jgi:MOSC domain-containing protein YiiM